MDDCKNADDLLAEIQLEDPNYQPSTKIHPIRPVADLHNIKPLEFDEIESDNPPAIEYILHPVLPAQGICFIYAASGLGKTLFTLNLAYAIAGGGSFHKYNCQIPRKVLYVDGEMPYKQLHARLMEIPKHQGILDYKKNLAFLTPDKIMPTRIPKIDELLGQQFYEQFIELYQYEVIIFDNLSMLSSIDESKSSEWKIIQDWLLYLRAIGKTVIIIHHAGKDKSGYRGTSRMLDCADTAISLQSLIDDELEDEHVNIKRFKVVYQKARQFGGKDAFPFEVTLQNSTWTWRSLELTDMEKAVSKFNAGMKQREIAAEMCCSQSKVHNLLKKARFLKLITVL